MSQLPIQRLPGMEGVRGLVQFKGPNNEIAYLPCELRASRIPAAGDDNTQGFIVGSMWYFGVRQFIATNVSTAAAVWRETSSVLYDASGNPVLTAAAGSLTGANNTTWSLGVGSAINFNQNNFAFDTNSANGVLIALRRQLSTFNNVYSDGSAVDINPQFCSMVVGSIALTGSGYTKTITLNPLNVPDGAFMSLQVTLPVSGVTLQFFNQSFFLDILRSDGSGGARWLLFQKINGLWLRATPMAKPIIVPTPYAATVNISGSTSAFGGQSFVVDISAMTGPMTLGNPTGFGDRQKCEVIIRQDIVGGRVLTLGSKFLIPSSSGLVSPINTTPFTNPNSKTIMLFEYDYATDKYLVQSFVPGY